MQVRELKPSLLSEQKRTQSRTSCRCVNWNLWNSLILCCLSVAPHAGAWIETEWRLHNADCLCRTSCRCVNWNQNCTLTAAIHLKSHLMQVRELKLSTSWNIIRICVAPHAGAWIETSCFGNSIIADSSRTSCRCVNWNSTNITHCRTSAVAPHAGAWIETKAPIALAASRTGRTSCRCVNWNSHISIDTVFKFSVAPHAGAWIET